MVQSRRGRDVSGYGAGYVRQASRRWSPRDKARALERLATARANLAGLERRATPAIEPSIRAAVEQRQQQIEKLRQQVQGGKRGRAGRQARQQIEALEGTQRLVIECLGFRSFAEFRGASARSESSFGPDRHVLEAARQEVDRAERHFFDTAEMAIPVPPMMAAAPPPPPPPAGRFRRSAPRRAS
jgi:hypothetical protein